MGWQNNYDTESLWNSDFISSNIKEMKTILDNLQSMIEDNNEYDNAAEVFDEIDHILEFLEYAYDSIDEATDLLELKIKRTEGDKLL